MTGGLRLFAQRIGEGAGEPVFSHDEELIHVQPSVSIVLGNRSPETAGTLYLTSKYCPLLSIIQRHAHTQAHTHITDLWTLIYIRQVVWLSDSDRSKGYAADFYSVSLHAVSRDPEAYPSPCIYAQVWWSNFNPFKCVLSLDLSY